MRIKTEKEREKEKKKKRKRKRKLIDNREKSKYKTKFYLVKYINCL